MLAWPRIHHNSRLCGAKMIGKAMVIVPFNQSRLTSPKGVNRISTYETMPKVTFMEFAIQASQAIRDNFQNVPRVVGEIMKMSKPDAVLVAAHICDQLHGEQNYNYFLSALARQV